MKKIILMLSMLCVGFSFDALSSGDFVAGATSKAKYSSYQKKRSRWCNLMRASSCKDSAKFQQYVNRGCVNDIGKESKCLKNFCMTNCATVPCPEGELATMCQEHCKYVSFQNTAAQNRLNHCVQGSLDVDGANRKRAGRTSDKAYLKGQDRARRGGLKEAQKVLNLVKRLTAKRKTLLYVDGVRYGGIVRIDDFIKNVKMATSLTEQMNQAVKGLQVSGQSLEVVQQAKALMARSDTRVSDFIQVVQNLSFLSKKLMKAVAQGSK
ncbi:hypothetical protein OAN21_02835 [Alphaproteobacteria bacterium]|nr:hypothetical protein [Alphaproteobacteria bacterium]